MMSTIDHINYNRDMPARRAPACEAWQLLTQLFFAHRASLPLLAAELQLSPAQCHVLHLGGRGAAVSGGAGGGAGGVRRINGAGPRRPPRTGGGGVSPPLTRAPSRKGAGSAPTRSAAPPSAAGSDDRAARHARSAVG